jgi:16S rRNA (guanine(1405)-N(7))-methyltransferase
MNKEEIINELKKSKKYKNIAQEILESEFEKFEKRNPKWSEFKEKHILKELKRQLHRLHGSFHFLENKDSKRREELIEKLKNNLSSQEIIEEILKTNKSTKERLEKYKEVYREIFKITGKPTSIIDLGCGLNPLSLFFMNLTNIAYNAYEINEEDVRIINEYFNIKAIKEKVSGKAELLDCSKTENLKKLPSCDLCFMFKFIDPVEKSHGKGHKLAEEIINVLRGKCKFMVVSFATRTISGKNMNFAYRGWIERMLSRIGMNFKLIDFSSSIGEVFYVISRS